MTFHIRIEETFQVGSFILTATPSSLLRTELANFVVRRVREERAPPASALDRQSLFQPTAFLQTYGFRSGLVGSAGGNSRAHLRVTAIAQNLIGLPTPTSPCS